MNKLRKKMITETETLEAYAANCYSTCYYNCSGPCHSHVTAGYTAEYNSNNYYSK
ncbi:CLI_3235 family bacteriocin precursor [Ruminiclostridium herbifermentans]|uniref:CLI_3235 family bacteriocin n=1 Tax=Ruminiclostridium herbifermentans TaxID=2488810 RepID=A0A7H1VPK9_9FIRM|nr:CLI_3235 family bacteriocin precursor [Ruminiclostridium herbifermentans]QNU67321.1 CLI_3235 family bacteriocin precursor [Ruminiclostridium herbifermentans]